MLPPWLLSGAMLITLSMAMVSGYLPRSLRHVEPVTLLGDSASVEPRER